ncbi:DUF2179 domain-containing protein [Planctomycetota bacterium]
MIAESTLYAWVILPLIIFVARIADVSLGTVRLIFIARGYRSLVPVMGFFEIFIWIVVVGQVMKNLSNVACYVAYAGGFATGNYVGMWLAEKLSLGMVMVRIVTQKDATSLISSLRADDYGVTSLDGEGAHGRVKIIFSIMPRRKFAAFVDYIKKYNPKAFYTVEEVSSVAEGILPDKRPSAIPTWMWVFRPFRKGK